jgi:cobalt transporter subunit CbtA
MYFRNLVLSAFSIAIVAGLFFTLYQEFIITPLILNAEIYEVVEPAGNHTVEAWAPADGVERSGFSFITNLLVCFAYSLFLMSLMVTRDSINLSQGAFWGGSAYLSVFIAPALGLPPEIPGMEAAAVEGRQAWWILTVILTAIGLWSMAFKSTPFKFAGLIMLITPHIIGAPQPEFHGFANQDPQAILALTTLWHDFIMQTSIANALLWLIIGVLSAFLVNKFIHSIDHAYSPPS